jgi:hypothetical protein
MQRDPVSRQMIPAIAMGFRPSTAAIRCHHLFYLPVTGQSNARLFRICA